MSNQKTITLVDVGDISVAYCHELEEVELVRPAPLSQLGRGGQRIVLSMEEIVALVPMLGMLRATGDAVRGAK